MYMTHQKLAVMTAHDFPSGTFADRAGSDIVLVGDSLGMVCLGYESTNLVTLSVRFPKNPFIVEGSTNIEGHDTSF
jgi:3-methyl-2-oxobutanoate hydroxymethyltransferase